MNDKSLLLKGTNITNMKILRNKGSSVSTIVRLFIMDMQAIKE
jgi:hypothetical protein